jgi:hypothetical protein
MTILFRKKNWLIWSFLLLVVLATPSGAQTYLEKFGQNRVQYRKFDWRYFDTKHFRIYHYDAAGRQLARYVSEQAENDITVVEKKLGGKFPKRFNIILYNNFDEYRQTNVGLKMESQAEDNQGAGGKVDIVGDKLLVYYTGVHTDLRRQLRSGMGRVVMERMLFGESLKQMVKNSLLLNMPKWTSAGYISYLVDGWDTKSNSDWKNIIAAYPDKTFHEIAEKYPELAGKAFWKFVSESYGENNMKNLLYNIEMRSSLNQATKITMGLKIVKAYDSCLNYFRGVYAKDSVFQEQPEEANANSLLEIPFPADNEVIRSIKVSPKGDDVAYVGWQDGEYKVYIQRTAAQKTRSVILAGGRQDYNEPSDPDYPIITWNNTGYKLAILYRKGRQTRLRIYNAIKAKIETYVIPPNRFDRVLSMTFMEDDDKLVFSAIKKSQTDLYMFTLRGSKMTNITNDPWDDVQPWFISGGTRRGVLFLSNRNKANLDAPIAVNELPTGSMNVFFYDTKTQRRQLLQCSNVKTGNISQPIQYGQENFAYLYDTNGIQNRYVVLFARDTNNMDSAYSIPVTNYSSNIINHQYNPSSNKIGDVIQAGGKYKVYFNKITLPGANDFVPKTLVPTSLSKTKAEASLVYPAEKEAEQKAIQEEKEKPLVKTGNVFQSEFAEPEPVKEEPKADTVIASAEQPANETTAPEVQPVIVTPAEGADTTDLSTMSDSTYLKMKAQPYRLSFKPDFFTVRADNSVLFNQYQSYDNSGGGYINPSLAGLVMISLDDIMENHRFTGGFRLPINFSGTTYFLQYQNFSRRVDWGVLYLRNQNMYTYNVTYVDQFGNSTDKDQLGRVTTNMIQGMATYPLDRIRSIRMNLGMRQDGLVFKAQEDALSLFDPPNPNKYWALSRVEYVFDNSANPELNIRKGYRYKFFGEYMYNFTDNKGVYNLGLDFRYYMPVYKSLIWATRIAGAHSGGSQKVIYYVGGLDNWLNKKYAAAVPPSGDPEDYAFQTVGNNMRGYRQNSRNGNTYAVLNTELRLPVASTFIKRPVQSAVLKNLQVVGFADIGSAWAGFLPGNANNQAPTYVFPNAGTQPPYTQPIVLQLKIPASTGWCAAAGLGLRTTLLGYFLRLDRTWNIESQKMWLISIGTDF